MGGDDNPELVKKVWLWDRRNGHDTQGHVP